MNTRIVSLTTFLATAFLYSCGPEPDGGSGLDTTPHPPLTLDTGDIKLSQTGGALENWESLYISFPTDMVSPEVLFDPEEEDEENPPYVLPPVVFTPDVPHTFVWLSPRRGRIDLQWFPSISYRLTLREGLTDREEREVNPAGWGAELASEDFGITGVKIHETGRVSPTQALPLVPRVRFEFSRDVLPSEVAGRVAFVDIESGERLPVVACLEAWQTGRPQGLVYVRPEKALTASRHYWIVVERLNTAAGKHETDYLRVYPAGFCAPVQTTYARGYNQPRRGEFVRVFFNQRLDPDTLDSNSFAVSPDVSNLEVKAEGKVAVLDGDFLEGVNYEVTVAEGVRSRSGVETDSPKEWPVRIPERRASVIMPSDLLAKKFEDGIDVELHYSRTQELGWKLAEVPVAKLKEVKKRLREFAEPLVDDSGWRVLLDPRDGTLRFKGTEPLISAMDLKVVDSGGFSAAPGDEEKAGRVRWLPSQEGQIAGLYLLEVLGKGADGRACGNRSLINLTDWFMNFIASRDGSGVRLSNLSDGTPVSGVSVQAYAGDGRLLEDALTDEEGMASFEKVEESGETVAVIAAGNELGRCFQQGKYSKMQMGFGGFGNQELPGLLLTNGDLFEPGEEVQIYAVVRRNGDGELALPPDDAKFGIRVAVGVEDFPTYEERLDLDIGESGGGTIKWKIPHDLKPTKVTFVLEEENQWIGRTSVGVTHFRPPAFSVKLDAETLAGTRAEARLASSYFHGGANTGATVKWKAEWVMRDWLPPSFPDTSLGSKPFVFPGEFRNQTPASDLLEDEKRRGYYHHWNVFLFSDRFSEAASSQGLEGVFGGNRGRHSGNIAVPSSHPDRGTAVIGEDGTVVLTSECPFPNLGRSHRAKVFWTVDVKNVAGLKRRAAAEQRIQFPKKALAILAKSRSIGDTGLPVRLTTIDAFDEEGTGGEAEVEVFCRSVNTVQERISDRVSRYRNDPEFESVWKRRVTLPFEGVLPAPKPGDYVVVASPVDMPDAPVVSAPFYGVLGHTDMVVSNNASFEAVLKEGRVSVGELAIVEIRTPFPGAIRATVETGDLLETLPVIQMSDTFGKVEVKVQKEYFPNAFIRLHLMGKTEDGGMPAERFAVCPLSVHDPEIELSVTPVLDSPEVRVRTPVSGNIVVKAGDLPLEGAEVLVFAIDDAVLSLGEWEMPEVRPVFYPDRSHGVSSKAALGSQWTEARVDSLSQFEKGFILGGGGMWVDVPTVVLRERKNPRPLWLASLQTDAKGRAPFSFEAPDSLTSYRIAALAHTANQFGTGETSVKVSNPLRVEPALPEFVREGDEIELRCQVTGDAAQSMDVDFSIQVEGDGELLGEESRQLILTKGSPEVVSVRLRAGKAAAGSGIRVIFKALAADGSGLGDATAERLRLLPRFTERTEMLTGNLSPGGAWNVGTSVPPRWVEQPGGEVDVLLSGTEWLPQLATLAPVPGKSSELVDITAASLSPLLVPRLSAYLPHFGEGSDPSLGKDSLAAEASAAIEILEESLIPDGASGWLPRFPGGSEPDDTATALVSWAVKFARILTLSEAPDDGSEAGRIWSERLKTKLFFWRRQAAFAGQRPADLHEPTPFVRSLALLSETYSEHLLNDIHGLRVAARTLFSHREKGLGLEGRCFLAMTCSRLDEVELSPNERESPEAALLDEKEWADLISEIEGHELPTELDPITLGSPQRAAAIRLLTLGEIKGSEPGALERLRGDPLNKALLVDGRPLTSQENIWRLLAANTYLELEAPEPLADYDFGRDDFVASPNGVTVGWLRHPAATLATQFPSGIKVGVPAYWLLRAKFRAAVPEATGGAELSVVREVYSHQDPAKKGTEAQPFKIGDYVLLNYRINCDQPRDFVVLEEQLPAALEAINPDLPAVREAFSIPESPTDAKLRHAEIGSHRVRLTFDTLPAGESTYSVLAQVVAGGKFSWPAAQATPIYDQRLTATTADAQIIAVP